MDQFLQRHNGLRLTQEEADKMNIPTFVKSLKWIANHLTTQKVTDSDRLSSEFFQTFKGKITSIVYYFFEKIETERIHSNSFSEARIILIQKPERIITARDLQFFS
jgi:hypothetical protein